MADGLLVAPRLLRLMPFRTIYTAAVMIDRNRPQRARLPRPRSLPC